LLLYIPAKSDKSRVSQLSFNFCGKSLRQHWRNLIVENGILYRRLEIPNKPTKDAASIATDLAGRSNGEASFHPQVISEHIRHWNASRQDLIGLAGDTMS
jgi:hypothetical protein